MIIALNILLGLLLTPSSTNSINNYLEKQLKDYRKFEYEITSPRNINENKFVLDESREFKVERNYAYMPVNFISKDGIKKKGLITLKVKLFKDVLVSSRKIDRKEPLNYSDFSLVEKEVTSLRVKPIYDIDEISKYRARFSISSETVLGKNMVEQIPDVKHGDRVTAIFNKGIVNISFDAIARTEGVIGDVIKVKTAENKMYKAEVINYQTVKVIE